jgi:prepilin-type N-terminal cleavage/methylation domain-containing protein
MKQKHASRRGASLIEVLCVIAIISILFAMTFGVSGPIRAAALETSSKSNLRQVYLALRLYQESQTGSSEYGTASEMGMPSFDLEIKPFLPKGAVGDPGIWRSPCGDHPVHPNFPTENNTLLVYVAEDLQWKRQSQSLQGRTVLASDPNCNPHNLRLDNPLVRSKYQVLRLDGSIRAESYLGLPSFLEYRN